MSAKTTAVTPAQRAVERYFEMALFLLIATGFLTLAGTGKLDAISLIFVVGALGLRGVTLLRHQTIKIPEQWTNYITVLYVLFYLADFYLISGNFVQATVHLVLFSMAVKLFSIQRERDYAYLVLLSFLMVLAAAVLTVGSSFLLLFCIFLLLAGATFLSLEMRRSAARAASHARTAQSVAALPRWLTVTAAVLMLGTAAGGTVLFFVLPRRTGGFLSSLAQDNQLVSGFSNEVELGKIGEIKQSKAVVMFVTVPGDTSGSYADMKWRGIALSNFDGQRWSRYRFTRQPVARDRSGEFMVGAMVDQLPDFSFAERRDSLRPFYYRVLMEPIGSNVFFVATHAEVLRGKYTVLGEDETGSIFASDEVGIYEGYSNLAVPGQEQLRTATGAMPANISGIYLQLPPLDPRIAQLAASVTAQAPTEYDKAVALEHYLKSTYGYTLQLPSTAPTDPLAYFLFERKRGHCEYFASAMAVMLRTLGIPARIVNGFRGGEFSDVTDTYIVRASSAHTWVEVFFPGYGWVSFDPTPPDPAADNTAFSRMGLYLDAMSEFWQEWVVNYDFAHQLVLHNEVMSGGQRRITGWQQRLHVWYRRLLARARAAKQGPPRPVMETLVLCIAALLLLANSRRMWRAWRRNRIARRPQRAPAQAASIWYERMTHAVARRGFEKRPSQTPQEFAASIGEPALRPAVERFTEHYEQARFGASAEDSERLPEIYEEIAMLK